MSDDDHLKNLLNFIKQGKTIIKDRNVLHFSYLPTTILHRKNEQEKILQSLSPILKHSRPSNLLIYGKPGTGKTLVVKKILKLIINDNAKENKFPIKLVYTNSKDEMTLYGLLVSLGSQLGLKSQKPLTNNEEWLPKTGLSISMVFNIIIKTIIKNKFNTVFVIDEIDNLADLVSKTGKDILYQLTRANERIDQGSLTLIGISNDLTFKERLDPRVISSLSEEEIIFTNYNAYQLKEILLDRIKHAFVDDNSVEESALNLCSALAGREHGDARRAIDLLRVASEIAEREQSSTIKPHHIKSAYRKMEEDKEITTLKSYSLHEKLLILSVLKAKKFYTGEIYTIYKEFCKKISQKELTQRRVTQLLSELELSGMVSGRIISQGIHGRTKKYTSSISYETVVNTLKNDTIFYDLI